MPAHCSLCRDEEEAPARQWLRRNSELLAASDQVISTPVDLHGLSTPILTDMLLNVRVMPRIVAGSEPCWHLGSAPKPDVR